MRLSQNALGPFVRGARPDEMGPILSLVRTVWPDELGLHYRNDPWFQWEQFRVVQVDGNIAGMLKIYRRELTWGGSTALMGGIGDVVTHPDHRRRGYAAAMLEDAVRYLAHSGYELSILFSELNSFYGRFGWSTVPEPRFAADRGGLRPPGQPGYCLRRFDAETDLEPVAALYAADNIHRHGALLRSIAYWETHLTWSREERKAFSVAVRDGQIVGYLRGQRNRETFRIQECIARTDHRPCLADLALNAARYARQQGCSRLELSHPADRECVGALAAAGVDLVEDERRILMVRPIAVQALARKLGAEAPGSAADLVRMMPPLHYRETDAF